MESIVDSLLDYKMTKIEAEKLKTLLLHIKEPDAYVKECLAIVDKQLEMYNQRRGQLKDQYEVDSYFG